MKKLALISSVVALAACSSGSNSGTTPPNGTTTIQNWPANRVGSLRFYVPSQGRFSFSTLLVGEADIAANGSFVLDLSEIATEITRNNATIQGAPGLCFQMQSTLTFSDPSAKFAAILPIAQVGINGQTKGWLGYGLKPYTNFPTDVQSGDEVTVLVYADKATQVSGSCNQVALNLALTPAQRYNFNMTLSQGWNYVRGQVVSTSPITVNLSATTTRPSDSLAYSPFPASWNLALSIWQRVHSLIQRE